MVARLLAEEAKVPAAVAAEARAIARVADRVAGALAGRGRLLYVGAGSSGRVGAADAAECPPTFGTDPERVVAILAGGPGALLRAVEGAEDSAEDGAAAVASRGTGPGDVVVGLSASGRTPFVLGALAEARRRRAFTALVTSAGAPRGTADLVIAPWTGPEAIAGSTRLKAATAAKLVCSAITTAAMVRLGKVHGNFMVDLTPACAKLRDRARRILGDLAGAPPAEADRLLAAAGGSAKVAVVMARAACGAAQARARLARARGALRRALDHGPRRRAPRRKGAR
ncbi:MAG: N-acetylmuramic acid 6-phosphate etherase [Planctomycetales bacterium]|nr:N-acetylmuramic acid 6-phosphate etherase [Planctomycetales bacterium]